MNKRLFVAIDPPEEIREQLLALCCGLPNARWVVPEQLHLTLCFIGEVSSNAFLDIREALAEITADSGRDLELAARVYFALGGRFEMHWLGQQISALPTDSHWQTLARAALRDDLSMQARVLTSAVLKHSPGLDDAVALIEAWEASRSTKIARCRQVLEDLRSAHGIDMAMMSVAMRELRALG